MTSSHLLALGAIFWISFSGTAQEPIEALYRLDRLPAYKDSVRIGCVSSYDRTGGNDDGFSGKYSFVRKEPDGLVLADLKGPGVIYRVWTPTPSDDILEFLFDGETEPRISLKFRELFLGNEPGFPAPLVGFGAGGYYCYVPIPFAKSCVVRMRAPKVQFYQINYALYAPEKAITTYRRSPESSAFQKAASVLGTASGGDITSYTAPPETKIITTAGTVNIKPNSSSELFRARKGGRIVGLRISPSNVLISKARDLVLKISFDGRQSVLCPLGDFFGYAWGQPAAKSLLIGTADGTNYCYFPMPYQKEAKIEIVSERATPVQLQFEVKYCAAPRTDNEGYFCALWRRENPTRLGEPYTFLDTTGRGHLVGVVLQSQGMESGKTLFFEGDDETTIDGEVVIKGTGSEDFFNGGWYDVPDRWEKRISFPLSGCLGYSKHLGRTGAYRLFLGDAYAFRRSLKQTIEHSGEKNDIPTDYCSVSYLYADTVPAAVGQLPPLKERHVIDPREVVFPAWWQTPLHAWSFEHAALSRKKCQIGGDEIRYLSLTATNSDWFGPHFLSPIVDVPETGTYAIYLEAVKGPGQAKVQLFQNENPAGPLVDLYASEQTRSGRVLLGKLKLEEGRNTLMFKLVGKNEQSSGLGFDLIQIACIKEQ